MKEDQSMYPGSEPSTQYPYVKVDGIDYDDFVLEADVMPAKQKQRALNQLGAYLSRHQSNFLGYQVNQEFDYKTNLSEFLNIHINNIGDPFESGNLTTNSKFVERAVLDYFASLWNARWPHEKDGSCSDEWKDSYWGYVLSMGSSEGNLYALWNARDYLAGKYLVVDPHPRQNGGSGMHSISRRGQNAGSEHSNAFKPIAFYSAETHYSIIKGTWILEIDSFYSEAVKKHYECPLKYPDDYPHGYSKKYIDCCSGWPKETPSDADGNVHIPALKKLVAFFAEKGYPPMLIFNYGTTFKGAYDNVQKAMEEIKPILEQNGLYERKVDLGEDGLSDTRSGYWVHVDGALGAAYMPFLEKSGGKDFPVFDFRVPEVHSICMSGHKWLGSPWPCGIFMSKVKYQMRPVDNPEYIGAADTTFSGSRNGFSAVILWDFISSHSVENLIQRIQRGEDMARYALEKFADVQEAHEGLDLWVEYSPHALTIRFRQANDRIVFKYSLSNETLFVGDKKRSYSHIYLMNSVTKELIDRFTRDLKAKDAFKKDKDLDHKHVVHGRGLGFR